ncbi:hypothetical protein ES703_10351 [subsurface metagenome]|nr:hypothetical protein [bacterium]
MKKLLVAGLALLAVGCFNYTSVMKIDPDGRGTLKMKVDVPYTKKVPIKIEGFEPGHTFGAGWHTNVFSVDTLDTIITFRLEGRFDSISAIPNQFGDEDILILKEKTEAGSTSCHLSRTYFSSKERAKIKTLKSIAKTLIGYNPDSYAGVWREKIVVPGRIIKHNATSEKGDTLIWECRTVDVLEKGLVIDVIWEK